MQKDVLSNAADAATPDASVFSRLRSSGSEVINSKISKLKSEMDSLMKKHQKYLQKQNQQVLRYSYMSNVQSAIPNQFNTIDANDTTSGINGEGFSSVQDALAALNNLGDKAAAREPYGRQKQRTAVNSKSKEALMVFERVRNENRRT